MRLFREHAGLTREFHPRVEGKARCPWNFSIKRAIRSRWLFRKILVLRLQARQLLGKPQIKGANIK